MDPIPFTVASCVVTGLTVAIAHLYYTVRENNKGCIEDRKQAQKKLVEVLQDYTKKSEERELAAHERTMAITQTLATTTQVLENATSITSQFIRKLKNTPTPPPQDGDTTVYIKEKK
jgi:hypothetical protein